MMRTNHTSRCVVLAGLLVISVIAGVALSGAVAAQNATDNGTTEMANGTTQAMNATGNASIAANPDSAGATANHTVNVTIGDTLAGGDLTGLEVNYTGTNASTADSSASVQTLNLSGESILANVTDLFSLNGVTMNASIDLNRSLQAGDQLRFVYGQAVNPPESGNYTVGVVLNPRNETVAYNTSLGVTESTATPTTTAAVIGTDNGTTTRTGTDNGTTTGTGMDSGTTTGTEMDNATTEETTTEETTTEETTIEETTEEETTEEAGTTTSGNGPGFTALVALVGVLAAALLATRRN